MAVPVIQESWHLMLTSLPTSATQPLITTDISGNTFLLPSPTGLNGIPLSLLTDSRSFSTSILLAEGNTYENLLKIIDDNTHNNMN